MKKLVIAVIVLFSLFGCEKYLNVNPVNKAYEDELFSDRSGFEAVLGGMYLKMSGNALYGRELKFGLLETLVGTYTTLGTSHSYYRTSRHQYNYIFGSDIISRIWSESYNVINQANIILNNLDRIENDEYYDLIKGEAMGIRCLIHFELLKLFGPVIKEEGVDEVNIPYKDKVDFVVSKNPTTKVFLEKLEKDLAEARSCLIKDPLRTSSRTANLNAHSYERFNSLIDRRGTRMNYYAVVAMQALVAQWKGDLVVAREYAEELLEEFGTTQPTIRLVSLSDLDLVTNKKFPMENIFSLMTPNILNYVLTLHPTIEDTRNSSTSPLLFPNYNFLINNLYNVSGYGSLNDYRVLNWFGRVGIESTTWKLIKNIFDPTYLYNVTSNKSLYENKIISIHTIYMIAAEEYANSNPSKAIEYLNKVRKARNLTNNIEYKEDMTQETILNLIFDEMRKDNIDEGYMFGEYKRQFRAIHRATSVKPSIGIFKFPIPSDEQLYNPQIK